MTDRPQRPDNENEMAGRLPSGGLPAFSALSTPDDDAVRDDAARDEADRLVAGFMARVDAAGRRAAAWSGLLRDLEGIGRREILATAEVTRQMAATHLMAMSGAVASSSPVARALRELRETVESVDPSKFDLTRPSGKLLGVIPRRNRLDAYLERYEGAQGRIRGLVTELTVGRAELERGNSMVRAAQLALAKEIEALHGYAYLTERLEAAIGEDGESSGGASHAARRSELLFAARRRRQEIVTQLAVAMQGYAALEIVSQNYAQLIRAVSAATTSTLSALRTGVMVAQALATRERIVENLRRAEEATMAAVATAEAIRGAGDAATASTYASAANIESLRRAWGEVFAALGSIERHRASAADATDAAKRQLSEGATGDTAE